MPHLRDETGTLAATIASSINSCAGISAFSKPSFVPEVPILYTIKSRSFRRARFRSLRTALRGMANRFDTSSGDCPSTARA
jgi:hypothetical protein